MNVNIAITPPLPIEKDLSTWVRNYTIALKYEKIGPQLLNPTYTSIFEGIADERGIKSSMMKEGKLSKQGLQMFLHQLGPFIRAQPFCRDYKVDKPMCKLGNRAAREILPKPVIESTTGVTPIKEYAFASQSSRQYTRREITCYECREKGHKANECPKRREGYRRGEKVLQTKLLQVNVEISEIVTSKFNDDGVIIGNPSIKSSLREYEDSRRDCRKYF